MRLADVDLEDVAILDAWHVPMDAKMERTLSGALLVWTAPTQGIPMDLVGGAEYGWLPRASLDRLRELASQAGAVYPLELNDGRALQVLFRVWEQPCIDGRAVYPDADPAPDDPIADIIIKVVAL
ncbi:hypothetical protein [Megalodesulfovibrio gigas]|uniref:Uncharacterized protein n=1 Tax=Megalodesulfovibrio gigas (strain ATCC 19364 / DSM 1382 / NCIMB 9332 / VKM B-1759) TaxID=1121448 RepID=T2GC28_MEGG1|nr:hypothetical protein [Megalodesulfovibrio gigas]AGW14120.1 hypothetical protein DGI_2368 [Megalodesulfovibrio gigas DSM 1382 = ATCC 19364]